MQRLTLIPFRFPLARMPIVGALVYGALLTGCMDVTEPVVRHRAPTTPTTPPLRGPQTTIGSVAGFVIDEADECIIGARVELIDGPRAGAVFVQTVCGFWDYGADLGYSFHDLPIGIDITVRATASGYKPADKRAAPTNPYSYTTMIVLTKNP